MISKLYEKIKSNDTSNFNNNGINGRERIIATKM